MFGFGVARVLLLASAPAVEGGAWPRAAALQAVEEAAARGEAPDAVLLEVHLPGLDGFQVLEALHQRHGARMAVLLMSVQHGGERVARAFQLGASDFVSKPFQVPEVMARLRDALVRAGAL
jgi:DNA-binding response OmpR family regulator